MFTAMIVLAIAQSTTAPAKADKGQEELICRSETELGSRIPRRVCRTKAEFEAMAREAQQEMKKSANQRGVVDN